MIDVYTQARAGADATILCNTAKVDIVYFDAAATGRVSPDTYTAAATHIAVALHATRLHQFRKTKAWPVKVIGVA